MQLDSILVSYRPLARSSPSRSSAIRGSYGVQCSPESHTVWASAVAFIAAQFRYA